MASPFARTLRSIESDKFNISLIATAVAIVIVVVWTLWFFFSEITLYADSYVIHVERNGYVRTTMPTNQMKDVRQGQSAIITLDGELGEEIGIISANVYELQRGTYEGEVTLHAPHHVRYLDAINDTDSPSGTIRIQIETASPAAIIMRALGRNADTPSFVSGPQQ